MNMAPLKLIVEFSSRGFVNTTLHDRCPEQRQRSARDVAHSIWAGYSANKERGVVSVEMRSGDTICDYKAWSLHVRRLLRAPKTSSFSSKVWGDKNDSSYK